jgi:hypothetical protein
MKLSIPPRLKPGGRRCNCLPPKKRQSAAIVPVPGSVGPKGRRRADIHIFSVRIARAAAGGMDTGALGQTP